MQATLHKIPFNSYSGLILFLDNLDISLMKMGTERTAKVLQILGNPQDRIKTVHVAGTNGKGSVCATLSSVYTQAGYRTGLFTSPHLSDIRERIQLNSQPINRELFLETGQSVYHAMCKAFPERSEWLTYFEFLTVMAFLCFARQNADIAIIETGLGGRLDATNVISHPEAVVITSISMDHMDRLGNSPEAIAEEKAGIFKTGSPVFTAHQIPAARQVISDNATKLGVPLYGGNNSHLESGPICRYEDSIVRLIYDRFNKTSYETSLLGRYQLGNIALALNVIDHLQPMFPVKKEYLHIGLKNASWPGRFQHIDSLNLVIDGSHNPDGFESLINTLENDFTDYHIHWGMSLLANRPLTSVLPVMEYKKSLSFRFFAPSPKGRFHLPESFSEIPFKASKKIILNDIDSPEQFCLLPVKEKELKILTGSLYTAGKVLHSLALL